MHISVSDSVNTELETGFGWFGIVPFKLGLDWDKKAGPYSR